MDSHYSFFSFFFVETKCSKGADRTIENTDLFPADMLSVSTNPVNEDGYSTSPHPPPRQRHPKAQNPTQFPCISSSSRTRTNPSPINNPGGSYNQSRNKVSFKDLHTLYGRPVLRDRNEWRYNKKAEESACSAPSSLIDTNFSINRQQNFLISL